MAVRLGGSTRTSYLENVSQLFSLHPDQPRSDLARQVALQSVRIRLSELISRSGSKGRNTQNNGASSSNHQQELLDGYQNGTVPLRIRPALVVLNVITLVLLGILGFHPRGQAYVPFNDKILHFFCFFFATGLFFCIWDIDEPARRVWVWRHMPLILTFAACFAAGGLGSEIVQSLLPYKTFQWGDVVANFLGSGLGLFVSYHAERRFRIRREIERLYEPLDQELYGDEEDEDDDLGVHEGDLEHRASFSRVSDRAGSSNEAWQSADAETTPAYPTDKRLIPADADRDSAVPARANDSIFSIADDDDDDDEDAANDKKHASNRGKTSSHATEGEPLSSVWREEAR